MEAFILNFINSFVEKNIPLVYIMFFISSILQLVFPPHPADVVLVFEGYLTTISSYFSFIPVLLNAMAGTIVGSLFVYKLGFYKGDMVLKYKLVRKYIDEKHQKRAERVFEKYGHFAIFISKFVPGVNAILLLFSGIFKVKKSVVYISVFLSVLLQHTLVLLLGRFFGHNMNSVKRVISTYNGIVIALLFAVLIAYIVYRYVRRKKVSK